jgi:hypothetical protein
MPVQFHCLLLKTFSTIRLLNVACKADVAFLPVIDLNYNCNMRYICVTMCEHFYYPVMRFNNSVVIHRQQTRYDKLLPFCD